MSYANDMVECMRKRLAFDRAMIAQGGSPGFIAPDAGCRMMLGGLGQATITTVTRTEQVPTQSVDMSQVSDTTKYAVGLGAFAVLGGLGYLAWKYPSPMMGGGYGYGYPYGGGRPGVMLTMNGRRRRKRRR